ncbi:helix-turn-helix transcriptional regulator [Comamonas testosteroni]|uniref:helix-turn-helix transcriptional regulator n=1 Tax=Comamonas testosteroni TaxID=285 RepID=UPI00350E5646
MKPAQPQPKISFLSRPPAPVQPYLRPKDAAQLLGVSHATLWRWHKRADFPRARKISRGVTLFDAAELMEWVGRQAQSSVK